MRWLVVVWLFASCAPPQTRGELRGSIDGRPFQPRAALARWTPDHQMLVLRFTDFACSCDAEEPLGDFPQMEMRFWLRPDDTRSGKHDLWPEPDRSPDIHGAAMVRWPRPDGHMNEGTRGIGHGRFFVREIDAHKLVLAFDIDGNRVILRGGTSVALCADGDTAALSKIR